MTAGGLRLTPTESADPPGPICRTMEGELIERGLPAIALQDSKNPSAASPRPLTMVMNAGDEAPVAECSTVA